jgi:hypothetical protein
LPIPQRSYGGVLIETHCGVKAKAKAFEMAQAFSLEQGLSKKKVPWDEIFPDEVLYAEEEL